jgi:ubiquinone/menaquinone biosynthesis C-methylase UbiE
MLRSYDDYYDTIAKGYDELYKEEQLKKLDFIAHCINKHHELSGFIKPGYRLLDVGCGTGISTQYFDVKEKCGIDPSQTLIMIAVDKYPKIKFLVIAAEEMPFLKKEFDIVISLTAIQNFSDIEKGLLKIKDSGKRFILTFLKLGEKRSMIESLIEKNFQVIKRFEQEKDIVYFCE